MYDLTKQVHDVLKGQPGSSSADQRQAIDHASKLFDEMKAKGLIDAPRYKLAPLDSVPPKAFSHCPTRLAD